MTDHDETRWLMSPGVDPWTELAGLLARPAWHDQAACRGVGPRAFFPERGQALDDALAYCDGCPVRSECRRAALAVPQGVDIGIWGGTSARQRRRLRAGNTRNVPNGDTTLPTDNTPKSPRSDSDLLDRARAALAAARARGEMFPTSVAAAEVGLTAKQLRHRLTRAAG